jgi:hypothetical protein
MRMHHFLQSYHIGLNIAVGDLFSEFKIELFSTLVFFTSFFKKVLIVFWLYLFIFVSKGKTLYMVISG